MKYIFFILNILVFYSMQFVKASDMKDHKEKEFLSPRENNSLFQKIKLFFTQIGTFFYKKKSIEPKNNEIVFDMNDLEKLIKTIKNVELMDFFLKLFNLVLDYDDIEKKHEKNNDIYPYKKHEENMNKLRKELSEDPLFKEKLENFLIHYKIKTNSVERLLGKDPALHFESFWGIVNRVKEKLIEYYISFKKSKKDSFEDFLSLVLSSELAPIENNKEIFNNYNEDNKNISSEEFFNNDENLEQRHDRSKKNKL